MVFSISIFQRLTQSYFYDMNFITEDMYDINQLQFSQKNFYLEFIEYNDDKYLNNLIPALPTNQKLLQETGFVISQNLMKQSDVPNIGKKWVSAQMIYHRYIYRDQQIVSEQAKQELKDLNINSKFYDHNNLYILVIVNQTFPKIKGELNKLISLLTDMSRNLPEMFIIQSNKFIDNFCQYDLLQSLALYQIRRQAYLRLCLEKRNLQQMSDEEKEEALRGASYKYIGDLLSKYKQVLDEIESYSKSNSDKFLGLVTVDQSLIKSIAVTYFLAGISSILNIIYSIIQGDF
ncbi:hypothetical protein PPERSA_10045 [Pseudocohnilembus persalinus]|uniref:Uncharacterized protein n=1 Tax=Pseudocohnilembus persalinus TaxID=266149 RepID=A0A0V0QK08_PSEPJ|nr:hypothetical protein PPERSA_10045 [Pseudocohnilembus persalinus]|eukprot:KRX02428.1 hypothetical protein PPERSA_10045 [Pseudocohnilembus persalinus]